MKTAVDPRLTLANTPLAIHQDRKESERFYTEVFNTVTTSFPLAGRPITIRKFSELGAAIKEYEHRFDLALNKGDATAEEIFSIRQCSAILKKLELPVFTREASKNALALWLDSEAACKDINTELLPSISGGSVPAELEVVLSGIRKEIKTLLGSSPPDLPDVIDHARFGPGASSACSREFKHPLYQMNSLSAFSGMEIEVQWLLQNTMLAEQSAASYYGVSCPGESLSGSTWRDVYSRVEWVDYERYEDVPKSIDKARSIGIGPNLATFVAQAYDHNIRERLRNWGLDLTNQEPNQRLAYQGSLDGDSCTLDLSCATDRVSLGLVHALLPPAWFRVLYPLRARSCLLPDGSLVRLEKFSSMGNSLTFSIMTLILAAIVRSVLREHSLNFLRWRVYGDDVIIPKAIYDPVVAIIERVGLKVNASKSYSEGFFRESCGCDFFAGVNVRPFFMKKPIVFVTDLYKYINLIQVVEARCPMKVPVLSRLRSLLTRYIPSNLRIYGEPSRYLDRYIWGPFGWGIPPLMVVARKVVKKPHEMQAFSMRLYARGVVESYVQPGRVGAYRKSSLYPDARVVVANDDVVVFIFKRKPGRKAWERVAVASLTGLDK